MIEVQRPMAESDVLDQVKERTGCTDAQVVQKVTGWVWEVLTATPESQGSIRTAHRFTRLLVDVEGPEIRILGH